MDPYQVRRERIAAQLLAAIIASGRGYTLRVDAEGYTARVDVEHAVSTADALIAELDRTSPQQTPSNQPEKPEGWVIWDDLDSERPVRCMNVWHKLHVDSWHGLPVRPFPSEEMALLHLDRSDATRKLRVRRWPLDPAEDGAGGA